MSEAMISKYQEEEIILHQGDCDGSIYKVMSGKVVLYVNYGCEDEYLVGVLAFPKCFGEMSVLIGEPSSYTAVALTEVTVLKVPEDNFETFIQGDHRNSLSIMKTMAKNLSMANMNIKMLIDELQHVNGQEEKEEVQPDEHIRKKEFTCPNCTHTFTDTYYHLEEDEVIPADAPTAWYGVITCPACYFSSPTKYFIPTAKMNKKSVQEKLEKIHRKIHLDFNKKRDINHILARYDLAITCAEVFEKKLKIKAKLCADVCSLMENNGVEGKRLEDARKAFVAACRDVYEGVQMTLPSQQRLCIRMAETLYKMGDEDGAKQWIKILCKDGIPKNEYADTARRLMKAMKVSEE